MFVDSHCHLYFEDILHKLDEVLQRMQNQKVIAALCVAVSEESILQIEKLLNAHEHLYGSIGIHPCEEKGNIDLFVDLLKNNQKWIAIGETGFDFYHEPKEKVLSMQEERFFNQIMLSKTYHKPLIIHMRHATEETIAFLRAHGNAQGVFHCFTEDIATAKRVLDLGFYISFSGIVTFKNALALQEVAKYVPSDRYLIETDSPYLSPVPHRGKINEPSYVKHVAEQLAKLRRVPLEQIAQESTQNFETLFSIKIQKEIP